MKNVYIYCGVPGSGKTTKIRADHPNASAICSADTHFENKERGTYDYDQRQLPVAHAGCLRRFLVAVEAGLEEIVVDNTNTSAVEVAPYAAIALAFGYNLKVITLVCDPAIAHERNIHGVPLAGVTAMAQRLAQRQLPPWWAQATIDAA